MGPSAICKMRQARARAWGEAIRELLGQPAASGDTLPGTYGGCFRLRTGPSSPSAWERFLWQARSSTRNQRQERNLEQYVLLRLPCLGSKLLF